MYNSGDKVTIKNPLVHKLYNVKPTDEFEVQLDNGHGRVFLANGWTIMSVHLNPVVTKPVFNLSEAVDEQIAHYIDEDYAFTAWDVTKALRENNPNEQVHHYIVKDIVHEIMQEIDSYERTLIEVGAPIQPWLYYPEGYAPETYQASAGAQVLTLVSELPGNRTLSFVTTPSFGQSINLGDPNPTEINDNSDLPQDVVDEIEQQKQDLAADANMPFNPPKPKKGIRKFLSKFRL